MRSYEERLETFSKWPENYRQHMTKRLAMIGQFALSGKDTLCTECVFCKKRLEDWKISDDPLFEHSIRNTNCPLFSLGKTAAKKKFEELSQSERVDSEPICSDSALKTTMIAYNIKKNLPIRFCIICGSTSNSHSCKKRVKFCKVKGEDTQYWQRFFDGEFIETIEVYLSNNLMIPDDKKSFYLDIIEFVKEPKPTDTIEDVLERGIETILDLFDNEMKDLEDSLLSKIEKE